MGPEWKRNRLRRTSKPKPITRPWQSATPMRTAQLWLTRTAPTKNVDAHCDGPLERVEQHWRRTAACKDARRPRPRAALSSASGRSQNSDGARTPNSLCAKVPSSVLRLAQGVHPNRTHAQSQAQDAFYIVHRNIISRESLNRRQAFRTRLIIRTI
jgi:hypothetical protein